MTSYSKNMDAKITMIKERVIGDRSDVPRETFLAMG
jgi:hypothetical protein